MSRKSDRLFGIIVLAELVVNEGIDVILDNITERAGANAILVNPIVAAEAAEGKGSMQPPADAGRYLIVRSLWGKWELWVHSGPSCVRLRTSGSQVIRKAGNLTGRDISQVFSSQRCRSDHCQSEGLSPLFRTFDSGIIDL